MEKQDTAESRGSAPGRQFQALLDAFQQRAPSKKTSQVTEEQGSDERSSVVKEGESEETWRRSLFGSPKKKLQARWEQVSPSVRQTLHRYSPRKLRELFAEEQATDENGTAMEDCIGVSQEGSQMLAERQSRYKQIAAFYLNEEAPSATPTTSSQSQSYLTEETLSVENPSASLVEIANDAHSISNVEEKRLGTQKQVPFEVVGNSDASLAFYCNDRGREVESQSTEVTTDEGGIFSTKNPQELENQVRLTEGVSAKSIYIPSLPEIENCELMKKETADRNIPKDIAQERVQSGAESLSNSLPAGRETFVAVESNGRGLNTIDEIEEGVKFWDNPPSNIELKITEEYETIACKASEATEIPNINLETRSINYSESEISSDFQRASSSCSNEVVDEPSAMPVGTPHIVLQAPDAHGTARRPMSLHPPPADADCVLKRKSPVTVQEWVDHLPIKGTASEGRAEEPVESAAMLRCQTASRLSREASVQSSSSLDSLLDSRRPDPVEVLLNLGFGGVPGIDLENCRIPKRFLVPSKCKGGDWDEFLRRELLQVQNFECASLGFRGLSGPSHQRPSAIVANIMEKLRERTAPRPPPKARFTSVARRVLSETSVLSRLANPQPQTPSSTMSVLTPDNRKFLESQGKVSPEVPRRRIIFGQKSFAIDKDGELVEEETRPQKESEVSASVGSWSAGSAESDSDDGKPDLAPSPADLLRIRRSSLQRQRNVEEGEQEQEEEGPAVPHRFLPVPEDEDDLRDVLAAEIQTLSRKIRSAPPEDLAAILEPIKELRVKLHDL